MSAVQMPTRVGPLARVRVLDLTSVIMGPFATQVLAQLGAEVIKVEGAEGDIMRHVGPMRHRGMGPIFLHANSGKQSIVLDLKHPDGSEAALRFAERCDVLISNVRPKAMARLGLHYEAVRERNPQIIYVSCCGFDQDGPDASRPAYDDLIQGATGIPWLMQQYVAPDPVYAPFTLADRVAALHAVYAIAAALYAREKTGQGQAIVVPMFEAMAQFVLGDHMAGRTFDPPIGEPGYARLLTTHRRPYATADGVLCVLIYNDKHWRSFFELIGESEGLTRDSRFTSHAARNANIDEVYAEVARILRTRTTAEWQTLLDTVDIPNMPMNSLDDLLQNPQLRATGFVYDAVHPSEGAIHGIGHPTRWSATPPARTQSPAPRLGEHTRSLLREVGYTSEQVDLLIEKGACRAAGEN